MEFTLKYLRPSPPKMSVKPSYIRKNLFPKYKSLPPPKFHPKSHQSSSSSHKKISAIKKRQTLTNSHSNNSQTGAYEYINENEYEDEEDLIDDSYLEMQVIIEKVLNRRYNSETNLDKLREEQKDEMESDFDSNQTYLSKDDWIFNKEARLVRALSDSIMTRSKKQANKQYGYFNDAIDDPEVEFMKIDSNYNDAIQEVNILLNNLRCYFKKFYILLFPKGFLSKI
jgi:hypothetical protein